MTTFWVGTIAGLDYWT